MSASAGARHGTDHDIASDSCVLICRSDVLDVRISGAQQAPPAIAVPILPDPKIVTLVISAPTVW
jgi:hypothetical protein